MPGSTTQQNNSEHPSFVMAMHTYRQCQRNLIATAEDINAKLNLETPDSVVIWRCIQCTPGEANQKDFLICKENKNQL